jgi:uncharacterized membrane protein YGL010W
MSNLSDLLAEYGKSHTNAVNKTIHFFCVPAIFWSVSALLHSVKLATFSPTYLNGLDIPALAAFSPTYLNGLDIPALAAVLLYYARLSPLLSIGFGAWGVLCVFLSHSIENLYFPLLTVALIVFTLAWIGQFIGHHIEGKKPSFLKDLQFLLIGPAWIMQFIYEKSGIKR